MMVFFSLGSLESKTDIFWSQAKWTKKQVFLQFENNLHTHNLLFIWRITSVYEAANREHSQRERTMVALWSIY